MKKSRAYEDIIRAQSNHWGTERVARMPETPEEFRQVWNDIHAEFRSRIGERGGSIYTNHQGILAIKTAFEETQQTPYPEFDGATSTLDEAVKMISYFKDQAELWGDKAGENFNALAGAYRQAVLDALAHKKRAVVAVDTTSSDLIDGEVSLRYEKEKRRHEAFHVWEYSVNPSVPGLLSEQMIKADPDYSMLESTLADYYDLEGRSTPNDIYSEAAAYAVAGAWWKAGFDSKRRASEFLGRFFTNVVLQYGKHSLDDLGLVHPRVKEIVNDIRSREITAPERDARGVQEGVGEGGETDGKTPRDGRAIRASDHREWIGGTGEDQRRSGPEPGAGREQVNGNSDTGIARQPGHDLHTSLHTDKTTSQTMQSKSKPTQELAAALQKIANIEAIDPNGTRSWKELAGAAGVIAREAITRTEAAAPVQDKELVAALEKIAGVETVDQDGRQLSWKDRVSIAIEIARETIEKTESTVLTLSVVNNVVEVTENTQRSLQREPLQDHGIGW